MSIFYFFNNIAIFLHYDSNVGNLANTQVIFDCNLLTCDFKL